MALYTTLEDDIIFAEDAVKKAKRDRERAERDTRLYDDPIEYPSGLRYELFTTAEKLKKAEQKLKRLLKRKGNPMPAKSPRDMTNAQIESRIEAIDKQLSKLGDKLIDEGRGYEKISETVQKTDPLSQRYKKYIDERRGLIIQAEMRYGPGYRPGALRQVRARRRNPKMPAKKRTASPAQLRALARGRAKLKAARRRGEIPKRKTAAPKKKRVVRRRNPDPALMRTGVLRSATKAGKKRLTNPPHYVISNGKNYFDGASWVTAKRDAAQYLTQKKAAQIGRVLADVTNKPVQVVPV